MLAFTIFTTLIAGIISFTEAPNATTRVSIDTTEQRRPEKEVLSYYNCDLTAALSNIGSIVTTLDVDCEATIPSGKTVIIPASLTLNKERFGIISGVTGGEIETLTINGKVVGNGGQLFGEYLRVNLEGDFPHFIPAALFGVNGDEKDYTTELQFAIDSLPDPRGNRDFSINMPTRGGGTIVLPSGQISVSTITIPEFVTLSGVGENTELTVSGSIKWSAIQGTNFDTCWGIGLKNMHIRGALGTENLVTGATYGGTTKNGHEIDTLVGGRFSRVTFAHANSALVFQGGWNNLFDQCKFRNLMIGIVGGGSTDRTNTALKTVSAAFSDNQFIACEFNNNDISVKIHHAVGNQWYGCTFYKADRYHFLIGEGTVGNSINGGRLEESGMALALVQGGETIIHNATTYQCIADTNGIADSVTEPGAGSGWTTYWRTTTLFISRRTWDGTRAGESMTTRYVPWAARNNKFKHVGLIGGSNPFDGKDGKKIPLDANFSFIQLDGDQSSEITGCYSANTMDWHVTITGVSFGALLENNNYVTANVLSGAPSYFERHAGFNTDTQTINGSFKFPQGKGFKFAGYTADVEFVQDTFAQNKTLIKTGNNHALHIRETSGVIHAPSNTFIVSLVTSAAYTDITVDCQSATDIAIISPRNAAAASFYNSNAANIYVVPESDVRVRIYHPDTATGTEIFNVMLF